MWTVKILGGLAVEDSNEMDWKLVGIKVDAPGAYLKNSLTAAEKTAIWWWAYMNKAYDCRVDDLLADKDTQTWYSEQVGYATPSCENLYKESYTTWTVTTTNPNNSANANPNGTCTYDSSKHDTMRDVSAVTELDGDADGWISPQGAGLVIKSVHEKWLSLALLHYDEDELEELSADDQTIVLE